MNDNPQPSPLDIPADALIERLTLMLAQTQQRLAVVEVQRDRLAAALAQQNGDADDPA